MNKHAHTPGPWDWKDGFSVVVGTRDDPEGKPIANIVGNPSEQFANARLIAAAPELLEALQNMLAPYNEEPDDNWQIAQARAAIAKAKGEAKP